MNAVGIKRLIFISSMGIYDEIRGERHGAILDPYRKSAAVIEGSGLDYTILRPAWLNEQAGGAMTRRFFAGGAFATAALAAPRRSKPRNSKMEIKRSGSQPSGKGPAEWFTGTVRVDPLHSPPAPARATSASVTFEPGARTAWHSHPLGQTLIVTAGFGRVQRWGGPVEEVRPGDVIWFPPHEKHWHGASPTTALTHIAIQEQLDGKAADWMEKVTGEQYGA